MWLVLGEVAFRSMCAAPDFLEPIFENMKVVVAQLCPIFCEPMDCVAQQAPLSVGFSRQK